VFVGYFTVTLFARLRGLSGFAPLSTAYEDLGGIIWVYGVQANYVGIFMK